jgi:hypothetical protein
VVRRNEVEKKTGNVKLCVGGREMASGSRVVRNEWGKPGKSFRHSCGKKIIGVAVSQA